jgi:hypothetical protein
VLGFSLGRLAVTVARRGWKEIASEAEQQAAAETR